jgi:Uncharacterized protein conserved in bacteria (DUF2252)
MRPCRGRSSTTSNGFGKADTRAATLASVAAYREAMTGFATMGTMDIWYAHLYKDQLLQGVRSAAAEAAEASKASRKAVKMAKPAVDIRF